MAKHDNEKEYPLSKIKNDVMKTYLKIAFLLTLLLWQQQTNAQAHHKAKNGIYVSADDFMHNKLSYGFDSVNNNNKLLLYRTFGSSKIQVISNGERKWFTKKEVYGYRENGIDYRLYKGDNFTIVDTADFYIYNQVLEVKQMKWKTEKTVTHYFSLNASSDLEPLTKTNIENALAYNKQFDHYLNTTFRSDEELISYDRHLKKYKLKYLYEEFEKQ